ncbi:MAG TPA: hypothetical protein CFH81_09105 [Sulfurovum sp. UBA12169]|nr:MAG TPA: hypothetical protein CFH81_09105 [Sulfurovum sp. UBA12169]
MKFILHILFVYLMFMTQSYGLIKHYTLTVESPTINEDIGTYDIEIRMEPDLHPSESILIYYETQNGTATAGNDYVALKSSKWITKKDSTITLTIHDDTIGGEGNEYFYFKITKAIPATGLLDTVTISEDGGLVTIVDNDTAALPRLSIGDVNVNENAGTANFAVTLSEAAAEDVTFSYAAIDGTATGGSDYVITSSTATIPAGSSSTSLSIPIIDDLLAGESDETFFVYLSNAVNAVILDPEGMGTIIDNDIAFSLAINDASIAEGDADKTVNVKVNFSASLPNDITLTYHTSQGTATANVDYTEVSSQTVTIPTGAIEHNLTFTVLGDTLIENAENFFITIDSVTGAAVPVIADGNSTVTIFDNDGTGGCSSYVGLMTINEYQNNPHYFDSRGDGSGNIKIIGNYVEIKYIDFLVKRFVTDDWSVSVYTTAGTQGILWRDKDVECIDPRYEVFQFSNKVMGAQGYVVLRDQNGNEVDVLNIDNSNHYSQQCQNFIYDTDFDASAQNKDLFREPDGTGDWYDHGTGANSGGSRCINKDGVNLGLIFTEFDAIDIDEPTPATVMNYASVPIKTKIADKPFDLKILSIDTDTGNLKNSSVTVKAYLANAMGQKLIMKNGSAAPGIDVIFEGMSSVEVSGFIYDKAIRQARVMFEYCENNASGGITDWDQCYLDESKALSRRHAYSRNIFAIRPDHFEIGISHADAPNLLRAGETYSASLTARDYSGSPTVEYTVTNVTSFNEVLDINHTAYFKDRSVDENGVLHGNFTNVSSAPFYSIDGLTSVSSTTKPVSAEEVLDLSYSDVGKVTLHVYDKVWASIDNDDTPLDCNGTFICGDLNITFIPHHFSFAELNITNHAGPDNNFTYVADEFTLMSAKIQTRIEAVAKDGNITQNFQSGELYYENNISVTPTVVVPSSGNPNGYLYPNANESNITNQLIGFGRAGQDNNGTRNILWDESTYPLEFNFEREINQPANPFDVNGSHLSIAASSHYEDPEDGDIADINGSRMGDGNATQAAQCLAEETCLQQNADNNATFFYARTRPSKLFYPDVIETSITTPVFIDVYCDLGHDACGNFGIDTVNAQITEYEWWLSLNHRMDRNDGNITLQEGNVTEGSSTDWGVSPTAVAINDSNGEDDTIVVSRGASAVLPLAVEIDLDTTNPTDTSGWLIYNPNNSMFAPDPFYSVRFIGQSGWAGHGDTGHVVETNSSTKKNKRVEW